MPSIHPNTPHQALRAFSQAALSIANELSLDKVLHQITKSAQELAGARYAALGVPGKDDLLQQFVAVGVSQHVIDKIGDPPKGLGLLGAITRENHPIRIPDIMADPRAVGFPEHHPPMRSFLGVPIISGNETLGILYLADKIDADEFTQADQQMIEVLAAHAAIAIRNAQLYSQMGRLAVTEERSRIGMDLHDGIIQSIYAVGLTLESARMSMAADIPDVVEADQLIDASIASLNSVINDLRNFIFDLRPQRFAGQLSEGLARLVREFQANTMVPVNLSVDAKVADTLPAIVSRTLFLTTQEALANVARHARAAQVTIELAHDAGQSDVVRLVVADNGRGFDTQRRDRPLGHGLANMRTRAEDLNGHFTVQSTPGHGTHITITLPIEHHHVTPTP